MGMAVLPSQPVASTSDAEPHAFNVIAAFP